MAILTKSHVGGEWKSLKCPSSEEKIRSIEIGCMSDVVSKAKRLYSAENRVVQGKRGEARLLVFSGLLPSNSPLATEIPLQNGSLGFAARTTLQLGPWTRVRFFFRQAQLGLAVGTSLARLAYNSFYASGLILIGRFNRVNQVPPGVDQGLECSQSSKCKDSARLIRHSPWSLLCSDASATDFTLHYCFEIDISCGNDPKAAGSRQHTSAQCGVQGRTIPDRRTMDQPVP